MSRFDPARLIEASPHQLSLMFNRNDRGTHGVRILSEAGDEIFKADATIDAPLLDAEIKHARGALRKHRGATPRSGSRARTTCTPGRRIMRASNEISCDSPCVGTGCTTC